MPALMPYRSRLNAVIAVVAAAMPAFVTVAESDFESDLNSVSVSVGGRANWHWP